MTTKSYPGRTSVHLPADVLDEIDREAKRQGRSVSWMVRHAWTTTKDDIRRMPSADELDEWVP